MNRFALFIAGLLLASSCFAQVPDHHQKAIEGVVNTLITSLKSGDNEVAFSMNTPIVRKKLQTPGNFARIIREHYQPLLTHTSSVVVEIDVVNGETMAAVLLDDAGAIWVAVFVLEISESGIWQVKQCNLFPTSQKGV